MDDVGGRDPKQGDDHQSRCNQSRSGINPTCEVVRGSFEVLACQGRAVWACDFVQVYDVWLRPLFAFFIVDVNTKEVVHVGVTRAPNARWTAQQLRQVTPFGEGPKFIIRDRDTKFGADFDRVATGAGIRVLKTAVQAPLIWSERWKGRRIAGAGWATS